MSFELIGLALMAAALIWALVTGNKSAALAIVGWALVMGAWAVLA